jgi:predicted nucleic acid-binding protein
VTPAGGLPLDTSVLSEWAKPRPDPAVARWLAGLGEDRAFISVVSLAEFRAEVERLPEGRRRQRLSARLADDLPARFGSRVLLIDHLIADRCGLVVARGRKVGVAIPVMDAFLAATAEIHGLALAARNVRDLRRLDVPSFEPRQQGGYFERRRRTSGLPVSRRLASRRERSIERAST